MVFFSKFSKMFIFEIFELQRRKERSGLLVPELHLDFRSRLDLLESVRLSEDIELSADSVRQPQHTDLSESMHLQELAY
jgi:hypothetical protein